MKSISRRNFFRTSFASTAALGFTGHRILGANDTIRVGVIGFNGRGKSHIGGFEKLSGVEVAALCDCDRDVLANKVGEFSRNGRKVKSYVDYRELLKDKEIDAVGIATPNHTHSLIGIEAIRAGKDVYVEKPVSHNVWEGRQLVNAARKHDRIVQCGTQSRSNPGMQQAMQYIHDGNLGKIRVVRGFCYKRRKSIGKVTGPQTVPGSVDYNLWCGPAPKTPLMRSRLHYDWHWVWSTGNGDLGNQGIHQMDLGRWALQVDELSPRILSIGGRLGYDDDGETANTQVILHDYEKAPFIFEVRGLGMYEGQDTRPKYRGVDVGMVIDCEDGYVVMPSYYEGTVHDNQGKVVKKFSEEGDHYDNFIQAMRSRDRSRLNGDILEGHLSSALCHTGNISHLLGKPASQGGIMDRVKREGLFADCIGRMAEHLAVNGVDLNNTPLTLGRVLKMDPKTERFTNYEKANKLLTRNYRAPFKVPEIA